jgi:pimeloyl-ACP methyl ester carboxylesterase
MPYAKNGDVNIYYEVEGQGPPLVMLHGFSGSLDDMKRAGYVEALRDGYQLVLMDLIGHGNSDKPHNPEAYSMEGGRGNIIAVLDDLHISSANIMGYSAGGVFSLGLAIQAGERVRSLILIDAGPHGSTPEQLRLIRQLFAGGPEAYVAIMEQSGPVPAALKARMLANDFEALVAILDSPTQLVDLTDELSGITAPCLVLIGENDMTFPPHKERELFRVVPDLTFKVLPGLDHATGFIRSDMTLPHIKEFLARVNKI